jgi:hypothetical protein
VYPHEPARPDHDRALGLVDAIAQTTTDAAGRFAVAVPPVPVVVQPHPEGSLLPVGEPLRLQRPIAPALVLAAVGDNPAGDLRGLFSRPFTLRVTIENDEERLRTGEPGAKPRPWPDVFVSPAPSFADESTWQRLQVRDGVATFLSETPSEPWLLVVRRRGFAPHVRQIDPVPGSASVTIRYP